VCIVKIFDLAHRRKRKPSVIKAGSYEDLPSHLQRAVDRVKEKVNQPVRKNDLSSRIKNILLGK